MKCKQVQELLPLYFGDDIEAKSTTTITAHLASCAGCCTSAEEYRESYQMIQGFTPPPFGNEVYDKIRQDVLREITENSGRSKTWTLTQLLPSAIRFNPGLAFATLLMLAISIVAFYFLANRPSKRQEVVTDQPALNLPKLVPLAGPEPQMAVVSPGPSPGGPRPRFRGGKAVAGRKTAQARKQRAIDQPALAAQREDAPTDFSSGSIPPSNVSAKPLRVEMQTNDRNIRIIWFSNQETKHDSPAKSSKGI